MLQQVQSRLVVTEQELIMMYGTLLLLIKQVQLSLLAVWAQVSQIRNYKFTAEHVDRSHPWGVEQRLRLLPV
jgi:hypothetical protein